MTLLKPHYTTVDHRRSLYVSQVHDGEDLNQLVESYELNSMYAIFFKQSHTETKLLLLLFETSKRR